MKSPRLPRLITSLVLALALPSLLPAKEEKTTELGHAMEDVNAAFRRLGRQVKDPAKNADSLERVAQLKAAAEKSLTLVPALAAEVPAERREKFIAGYRAAMRETIATIGKLEAALKAGDNAAAEKLVEQLKEQRNEGHKAYKKPD